jgi:hypothetical protein
MLRCVDRTYQFTCEILGPSQCYANVSAYLTRSSSRTYQKGQGMAATKGAISQSASDCRAASVSPDCAMLQSSGLANTQCWALCMPKTSSV